MADSTKKYVLMHKNIRICDMELDGASGAISSVGKAEAPQHIPVGIMVKKGTVDRAALNVWWRGRAIPASRDGIRDALAELNLPTTQNLPEKCLGLSLSDQYWICPAGSGISWPQVNFFDNPFSGDVGDALFGKGSDSEGISLMSPDNTSDGWLKKKWIIIDGKRCLVKGGSGALRQEPYNEVLASAVMERLGIPHVPYTLLVQEDCPYSVCTDFITPDTELVSAWHIMQVEKKPNHVSVYQHYLDCCHALGIEGMMDALDRMIALDYLIANGDRHQNNFGAVRNADTLEWIGAAPIYDSGSSLWFDKPLTMISGAAKLPCKPFKNTHEEQIKLVASFDWLDLSALRGIEEELREILRGSLFIDAARCDALCRGLQNRVEMLAGVATANAQNAQAHAFAASSRAGDVAENAAYCGAAGDGPEQ